MRPKKKKKDPHLILVERFEKILITRKIAQEIPKNSIGRNTQNPEKYSRQIRKKIRKILRKTLKNTHQKTVPGGKITFSSYVCIVGNQNINSYSQS